MSFPVTIAGTVKNKEVRNEFVKANKAFSGFVSLSDFLLKNFEDSAEGSVLSAKKLINSYSKLSSKEKAQMFTTEGRQQLDNLAGNPTQMSIALTQGFLDKWTQPAIKFLIPEAVRDVIFGSKKASLKEFGPVSKVAGSILGSSRVVSAQDKENKKRELRRKLFKGDK